MCNFTYRQQYSCKNTDVTENTSNNIYIYIYIYGTTYKSKNVYAHNDIYVTVHVSKYTKSNNIFASAYSYNI